MVDDLERLTAALADRYRFERELGSGGMATVYLAEDLKHKRKVAVKVLRPELAAVIGAERFLKEIETTANLQHPHILPLFDSGQVNETAFYVMPFVEGTSLRERLSRDWQLPVADAVRIATEVANALDSAHRRGIIHRDIKPENILLHDGSAVVADFGIALAVKRADTDSRMTDTGMSIGTPKYMSPEQAMGERNIDARTDVYALACVLYEMLAGQPPHTGPTAMAIIASVLTSEPMAVTEFRPTVPPNVAAATMIGLNKLPADRFSSAKDFAAALGNAGFEGSVTPQPPKSSPSTGAVVTAPATRWGVGAGAAALIAVAAWGWLRSPEPGPSPHLRTRFPLELMSLATANGSGLGGPMIAISPDGQTIATIGPDSTGRQLNLRSLSEVDAIAVERSEGASMPFFSPDGNWLGFHAGGQIRRMSIEDGTIITVAAVPGIAVGASWGANNQIAFAPGFRSGLMEVPAEGGEIRTLTQLDTARGEKSHRYPNYLPGGNALVFTVLTHVFEIWTLDLRTGQRTFVVEGAGARYVRTGHLVYSPWLSDEERVGSVTAIPFDIKRLEATGNRFVITEQVGLPQFGAAFFDVSDNGTLIYLPVREVGGGRLLVLETATGTERPLGEGRPFSFPAFSPDGSRLAVAAREAAQWDLWSYDLVGGGTPTQITTDGGTAPLWSADGHELVYSTGRWMTRSEQPSGLARRRVEGAAGIERIMAHDEYIRAFAWTPDRRGLLYYAVLPRTGGDIFWLTSPGNAEAFLADTNSWELWGDLTPDGRWLAYTRNESGRNQIYLTPFPERNVRIVAAPSGGHAPKWSSDGLRLFFLSGHLLLAVPVRLGATPTVGTPDTIYRFRTAPQTIFDQYDVHPHGGQIAISEFPVVVEETPVLVINWFDELLRRASLR